MLTRITGGRIIDPANGRDETGDIWMRDGRIVEAPPGANADATYDATGKIVMAGAIDIHSHIAGWSVNTARPLLPEFRLGSAARPGRGPSASARGPAFEIGAPYAPMGFPTGVEPPVLPPSARPAPPQPAAFTATISGSRAARTVRLPPSRPPTDCRFISLICSSMVTARRADAASRPPRRASPKP